MLLKRKYQKDEEGLLVLDENDKPIVKEIHVLRAKDKQHFSPGLIEGFIRDGFATMANGVITLHTVPEVTYKIVRYPGYYCCHCNEAQPDGTTARVHLLAAHKDLKSPDDDNPAGYRRDNFYACERVG